jgi:signal peptidase II
LPITRWVIAGMGLVLGGGLSNLGDRLFRDHGGSVVDFIDVGTLPLVHRAWPVFNIADMCIVAGALLIAAFGTGGSRVDENGREPEDGEQ